MADEIGQNPKRRKISFSNFNPSLTKIDVKVKMFNKLRKILLVLFLILIPVFSIEVHVQDCGNGVCEINETRYNCPEDCKSFLTCKRYYLMSWHVYTTQCSTNPTCEPDENVTCDYEEEGCSNLIPACGNSNCESWAGENGINCPQDCKIESPPYNPEKYNTLVHDDRNRTYMVYVPYCYNGTPIPVILALHGGGGTGEAIEMELNMNEKADKACFIAVYPNGVSVYYPPTPGRLQMWNSGRRDVWWDHIIKNVDDVGFISALIDDLQSKYSIDIKKIYATGLSNGGRMSYRLACDLSDKIVAIAPIGSPMHVECNPQRPVSIIHFHGTDDKHNPYNGGISCEVSADVPSVAEVIGFWTEYNSCPQPSQIMYQKGEVTCETYGPCNESSEVTLCTIAHGGHTVPGGYAFPIEKLEGVGKITRDINATDAMWEFFENHSLEFGPGDYNFSLVHDELTRKYTVHIPPGYNKNVTSPVVIYLHGGGGSIRGAYLDGMDKSSDSFGFILVIPAGTGPIPDILLTWNGGEWIKNETTEKCCGYASEHNVDDVGFISEMIDKVKKNFNVDEKRIYATGISNGGLMSYRLACELSDKIVAVAPVAPPGSPSSCTPLIPVSIMHVHGTADPCAPFNGGLGGGCLGSEQYEMQSAEEMVDSWVRRANCSVNFTIIYQKGNATCISYRECKDGTEVEFCTIEGGGHTWPSGSQYLPIDKIGPVSYDLSNDQIWEFFERHPMSPVQICGNGVCEKEEGDATCPKDCCESMLHESSEKDCVERGWQKLTVNVNGLPRKALWKGPQGAWKSGAIIAMHGGGGDYSNYCGEVSSSNKSTDKLINNLNKPMREFSDLAIKEGFAVFSLDSSYNLVTDFQDRPVGKRWDSLAQDNKQNIDLPFIKEVITETIPNLRTTGSNNNVFITGISNGGFMTILASTHLPGKITAFAPVSSGDPYGAYFDMGTKTERECALGVWRDSETNFRIDEENSCIANKYPNEKNWPTADAVKPSFKQFHHEGDGACDISCMRKARSLLIEQGYQGEEPFVIKNMTFLGRSPINHFWQSEYNQPIIEFFKKYPMSPSTTSTTTTITPTTTSTTVIPTTTTTISTNSTTSSTTTTSTTIPICSVKGDQTPCDDLVDDFELLDYIINWAKGIVPDFDLLDAIKNWAEG